jgi:hypothetical protein
MSKPDTQITKEKLKATNAIKINPDNYSWTLLEATLLDDAVRLKVIKTSKLKKLIQINELEDDADQKIPSIPEEMTKLVTIKLNDTDPNNQIFFQDNVQNMAKSFTYIFDILKGEA